MILKSNEKKSQTKILKVNTVESSEPMEQITRPSDTIGKQIWQIYPGSSYAIGQYFNATYQR